MRFNYIKYDIKDGRTITNQEVELNVSIGFNVRIVLKSMLGVRVSIVVVFVWLEFVCCLILLMFRGCWMYKYVKVTLHFGLIFWG